MPRQAHNNQQIHIRLPADMAKLARVKANREKRPLSEIIRELLRAWLAH
jgi:hypothetical protein